MAFRSYVGENMKDLKTKVHKIKCAMIWLLKQVTDDKMQKKIIILKTRSKTVQVSVFNVLDACI